MTLIQHPSARRALFVLAICLSYPAAARAEPVFVHCGRVIDGVGDQPRPNATIVVEDRRIDSVADTDSVDTANGRVIDLRPDTCVPGLIDAHVHLLIAEDDYVVRND